MTEKPVTLIKPNMCPICVGKLVLKEIETATTPITDNGTLYTTKCTAVVDSQIVCTKCGATYKARKSGMFYMIDTGLPIIRKKRNKNPFYE